MFMLHLKPNGVVEHLKRTVSRDIRMLFGKFWKAEIFGEVR
jgi:hypothetical protein